MKTKHFLKSGHLLCCFLLVFIGSSGDVFAQACGTEESMQESTFKHVDNKLNWPSIHRGQNPTIVPLKFHIIGAINGAFAIDSVLVFDELARVNDAYFDADIQFEHCGFINYIYDNQYLTFTKITDEVLCNIHDVSDAINIYFAPNVVRQDGSSLCGYAYNYDVKKRVLMDNGCSTNGSTLAHELGHSFSLLHTHSSSRGEELVNGSNCSTAGDLLCDTPADPQLSSDNVSSGCDYTGTETDILNFPYSPDTRNIMSYSRKSCRLHFSPDQLAQIASFHEINQSLLGCSINTSTSSIDGIDEKYHLFPMPTSSVVFIENIPTNTTLRVYSFNGKKIFENIDPIYSNEFKVDLSSFAPGVYFISFINNNKIKIEKIIKI